MAPRRLIHKGHNWTPDEDGKLRDLIESGKSWVLISAVLKRSQQSIKNRARALKKPSGRLAEMGLKSEVK